MRTTGGEVDLATVVRDFQGTRKALAAHLGLSERTLYRRLKAEGLA
ncbi:helix-turn-helix domain-containing protein [Pandoraea sp. B-6]